VSLSAAGSKTATSPDDPPAPYFDGKPPDVLREIAAEGAVPGRFSPIKNAEKRWVVTPDACGPHFNDARDWS
jgi:hypothetical protein